MMGRMESGDERRRHLEGRIRSADRDGLVEILRFHGDEIDVVLARQVLRHPFLDTEGIELLAAHRHLLSAHEIQFLLVGHRHSPQLLAQRLLPTLYWRELAEIGVDMRLRPTLRRQADRLLATRLPRLAVGEKLVVARRGSSGLLETLRRDPSPRVFRELLRNPRLTEAILLPLACDEGASPAILELMARDRHWGLRYGLRQSLCLNPRTPVSSALSLLPSLRKVDLRRVVQASRVSQKVRQRAALLLGDR